MAEGQESQLRQPISEAFNTIRSGVVVSELSRNLSDQDEEKALETTGVDKLEDELSGPIGVGILAALLAGATSARQDLPPSLRGTPIDALDKTIQDWARTNAARNVRDITTTSRTAIQNAIAESLEAGGSTRRAAREIKNFIGLTMPQQRALQRQRLAMIDAGATKNVIERTLERRAASMLQERANTIARNEAFLAVGNGRQLYWDQLIVAGELDEATRKKWITAQDEFVCPICRPMHRQIKPVNEPFDKGLGGTTMSTPAHIICRCSVLLIDPRKPDTNG